MAETSDVRKRVRAEIRRAQQVAEERRHQVADATRDGQTLLRASISPLFRKLAGVLRAEGHPFRGGDAIGCGPAGRRGNRGRTSSSWRWTPRQIPSDPAPGEPLPWATRAPGREGGARAPADRGAHRGGRPRCGHARARAVARLDLDGGALPPPNPPAVASRGPLMPHSAASWRAGLCPAPPLRPRRGPSPAPGCAGRAVRGLTSRGLRPCSSLASSPKPDAS